MSENGNVLSIVGENESVKDATENACIFKPEDIAEKLGVPATRIGVYARSFEDLLVGHMELTPGGHRRFSATAVRIMLELHLLIKGDNGKPGLSYELAKEEMGRRLNKEDPIGQELLPYEAILHMKELSKNDRELYGAMVHVQETNHLLLQKMDEIIQNSSIEKAEMEARMDQNAEDMAIDIRHSAEQSQALHTLYLLKAQGKPSLMARLLGTRNAKRENEVIRHCEEILQQEFPEGATGQKLIDRSAFLPSSDALERSGEGPR